MPTVPAIGGTLFNSQDLRLPPDRSVEEREDAVADIVKASCGEVSSMALCTGQTKLHNLEPEDMRAQTSPRVTLPTSC
ncbi:MAG: hypothetical protein AAF563_09490 [Pseudomonadota bacterium]